MDPIHLKYSDEISIPSNMVYIKVDPIRKTFVTRKCLKCPRELQLPEDFDDEEIKYRCPDCDPSSETEKYEWEEDLQSWYYVCTVYKCETCNNDILYCKYANPNPDLDRMCPNCNPSSETEKYVWKQEECKWIYSHSIYSCPTCKGEIKTYSDYRNEDLSYFCKNCDPSSEREKCEWNETAEEWILLYTIQVCPMCQKKIHLYDTKPVNVYFDQYRYNDKLPTVHGYNCSHVPSSKVSPISVQYAALYVNGNIIRNSFYAEMKEELLE